MVNYWLVVFAITAVIANVFLLILYIKMRKENIRLQHAALTDPLTELFNRRGGETAFNIAVDKKFPRRKEELKYHAIWGLVLDVDHFKSLNDRYGHKEGDRVLRVIARILKSQIRETDICFRLGGEEFAVVFVGATFHLALAKAHMIREVIKSSSEFERMGECRPTVSIGIVGTLATDNFWNNQQLLQSLLERGDEAMYEAKETGRDRMVVWRTTQ